MESRAATEAVFVPVEQVFQSGDSLGVEIGHFRGRCGRYSGAQLSLELVEVFFLERGMAHVGVFELMLEQHAFGGCVFGLVQELLVSASEFVNPALRISIGSYPYMARNNRLA